MSETHVRQSAANLLVTELMEVQKNLNDECIKPCFINTNPNELSNKADRERYEAAYTHLDRAIEALRNGSRAKWKDISPQDSQEGVGGAGAVGPATA